MFLFKITYCGKIRSYEILFKEAQQFILGKLSLVICRYRRKLVVGYWGLKTGRGDHMMIPKPITKEEADAERRRREQETVAARNARRGANTIRRCLFEKRRWSCYSNHDSSLPISKIGRFALVLNSENTSVWGLSPIDQMVSRVFFMIWNRKSRALKSCAFTVPNGRSSSSAISS